MTAFGPVDLAALERFLAAHDRVLTLRQVAGGDNDPAAVAVRHDVDDDLDATVAFARWERLRGWQTTYFLLPTAPYSWGAALSTGRVLEGLGHEVGLHIDVFHYRPGDPAGAVAEIARQAQLMRRAGLDVTGGADHGSGAPYNVDLWRVHGRTPGECGLDYEAYGLHQQGAHYLSDSGGRWNGPLQRVEGRQTHVLVHPQHWQVT